MKLIILDRDGVINHESRQYIKSPAEWIPIPGSLEAIGKLTQADYTIAIATNQSGIARGLYDEQTLTQIHTKLKNACAQHGGRIEEIFYCPHQPDDKCHCRKPEPGLLLQISDYFDLSLTNIPFIGDGYRDVQAARKVGCKPILVKTGVGEEMLVTYPNELADVPTFENLAAVVKALLKE